MLLQTFWGCLVSGLLWALSSTSPTDTAVLKVLVSLGASPCRFSGVWMWPFILLPITLPRAPHKPQPPAAAPTTALGNLRPASRPRCHSHQCSEAGGSSRSLWPPPDKPEHLEQVPFFPFRPGRSGGWRAARNRWASLDPHCRRQAKAP